MLSLINSRMFYYQGQIKDILHCQNCGEIYKDPKVLPCGESLCEVCLKKIESTLSLDHLQYTCPLCDSRHVFPEDGHFPKNMSLISLLKEKPTEFLYDQLEERLKLTLDNNENLVLKLERNLSKNGVGRVKEYCGVVRAAIKEARNHRFESITRVYGSLISQVNLFEAECVERLASSFVDFQVEKDDLVEEARRFEAVWRGNFQKQSLDKERVKDAIDAGLKFNHKLADKIDEIDRAILNNKTCEFHKNYHELYDDVLGNGVL